MIRLMQILITFTFICSSVIINVTIATSMLGFYPFFSHVLKSPDNQQRNLIKSYDQPKFITT